MNPLTSARIPGRSLLALALAGALGWHATAHAQAPATPTPPPPSSTLDAPLFFQLLLGELNVEGDDPGTGYSLILDAAQREKDGDLFQRAVEIALRARSGESALAAARAWSQALPDDKDASRYLLQILLVLDRVGETGPVLKNVLANVPAAERNDAIGAIPQTFNRATDKAKVLSAVREGLAPYLGSAANGPAAWTTIGRLELALQRPVAAAESARKGHGLDAASPYPALLALELLEGGQPDAEALIREQIDAAHAAGQANLPVAIGYARVLLDLQRLRDARVQLERLTTRAPRQLDPWLLLGSLQVQDRAWDAARLSLQTYLDLAREVKDERSRRGTVQAYLLLAQAAEGQQDFAGANAWLDRIDSPEDAIAVQARRASVLARQGKLDQARELLRALPERRPEDARLKLIAEAQLLRDAQAWQQAYEVYGQAAQRFPDEPELLYDQALMAERAGQPAEMERLLRALIAAKPDHQHAYNALGYALADRGERLPEAKALIEKALSLSPGDAYIQDSLGWVEFRLGNTDRALGILRDAFARRPDAEIAAHLGEVLWSKGQQDEAKKVWREGLFLANDNETLQKTLRRLNVQP